jgi:hypothetical protein
LVASGIGELRKKVKPGLYMIQVSSGIEERQHMITVKPDEPFTDLNLSLPIESPAPLKGLADIDEGQNSALANLSVQPLMSHGTGARLVLFVRNPPNDAGHAVNLSYLSLRDSLLKSIVDFQDRSSWVRGDGWAGLSIDLSPGGYSLHWREKRHSRWKSVQAEGRSVDQSLWLEEGWTTALFLATNPHRDFVPRMTGMTAHMRRINMGFEAYPNPEAESINIAQELALNGLRSGTAIVPSNLLRLLLERKFSNPMLGIIGAHALLQSNDPPWSVFDQVVRNLRRIVPNHPDVLALRLIGKLRRRIKAMTRSEPITWPPMVYDGYRGLIDRDWAEAGLISMGSIADMASLRLLPQGPWTVWSSLDEQRRTATMGPIVGDGVAGTPIDKAQALLKEIDLHSRTTTVGRRTVQAEPMQVQNQALNEATLERIRTALAEQRQDDDESVPIIAQIRHLGIPMSSITRVLKEYTSNVESGRNQPTDESG